MKSPFTVEFPVTPDFVRRGGHWWIELGGIEVRLSNLEKVLWPEDGLTKGDLIAYYLNVSPYVLPHVEGRPLTLKRMPDGIDGGHFYQKDAPEGTPGWMPRCAIEPEDGEVDEMLVVREPAHLLHVANLGAIELHPLHGRCERYDRPDYMLFDLDPFGPAGFAEALAVARLVKAALDHLGLRGYAKTSGATGLQVYVPVEERHTYPETRLLSERIGRTILAAEPGLATMEWQVSGRSGRVFIDHNMNRRAASIASAYSVRPRPGATVSTPLTWDEVHTGDVRPDELTIRTILGRVAERGDLFLPAVREPQDLRPALEEMGVRPGAEDGAEGRLRRLVPPREGTRRG